jgi:hypothetical protein
LRALNGSELQTVTEARAFFDKHQAKPDDAKFELWLAFLVSNDLVNRDGEVLMLTRKGFTFLMFLVKNGKRDPWF